MSTRHKRNTGFGRLVVPALSLSLISYFAYHAWSGRHGIESMRKFADETVRLEFELTAIKTRRHELEAKVMLLRDGSIERDMLDEQARNTLNLAKPGDLVILR